MSLSLPIPFGTECVVNRRGATTDPATGLFVRRQLRSSVSRQTLRAEDRTWSVTFRDLGLSDWTAFLAAHDAALGAVLPISWVPPPPYDGDGAIPVRIIGKPRYRRLLGNRYEIDVDLEEVA